jgi:DNA polymerase
LSVPILFRDYETRSTEDLKRKGAWKYARHPATDVWCCAYAVDDGEINLWLPGHPVPEEFTEAARNPDWIVSAFNAGFERRIEQHIMGPRYGWPLIPIERQRCSQAAALALALPASLEKVAAALDLAQQKDDDGHRLMMQMARPRHPRQGEDPNGIYWFDDLDRRARLYEYCKQDVATERAISQRIPPLSAEEQKLWELDAEINDRGIPLDVELLRAALAAAKVEQDNIEEEFLAHTQGSPQNINQAAQLLTWLQKNGCDTVKDIRSATLEDLLEDPDLPTTTRRVIELRLAGAHASANKLRAMAAWCDNGRLRSAFRFHGASTGRWTSVGVQLQNLKRPETEDLDAAIDAVISGDLKAYDRPMAIVGDLGRAIIAASPGHRFIAADLSGIESRITAWVSGQKSKVNQWAKFDTTKNPEDEPYRRIGIDCFQLPDETARDTGKTGDLAFGYSGGKGAWRKLSPNDGRTDDQIKALQQRWRAAHPDVVQFWRMLDRSAVRAVKHPGTTVACGKVSFRMEDVFLKLRLPGGRELSYPFPRIETNERGEAVVVFKDNAKGRFVDCRGGLGAYGGLWMENVVQAIARDVFAAAMPNLECAGYPIVMHVHDEIVAEVSEGRGTVEEFVKILTTQPPWAEGLPLAAKGRNGPRFAKSSTPAEEPPPWEPEAPPIAPEPEPQTNGHANDGGQYRWQDYDFSGYTRENSRGSGRVTNQYCYEDPAGRPYLRVNRTSTKHFFQEHWTGAWILGKPPGGPIPFRLPQLIAAGPEDTIIIAEGEKDALTAVSLGFVATCNPGGAGKFTAELARWFVGKKQVIIGEDNDDAGRAHVAKTAAALQGIVPDIRVVRFPDLPKHGDLSDWAAQGYSRDDLLARAQPAPKPTVECVLAAEIEQAAVEWVWYERFARGKLGIIAGLPDEGKGLLFSYIIAAITQGRAWPCNEGTAPLGNVILLTAEDDLSDTVVPRLVAAGADLRRVTILRMVPNGSSKRMFSLVTDLEMLRHKIEEIGEVQAILIDPITAYLGVKQIDSFRTTDVRAVLAPMVELATELRVLILAIMHFNKKLDVMNVLLRISDSLAFGATSRHCYAVVSDPENKRSLIVKGKNNLAPKDQKALAFTIDTAETGTDKRTGKTIRAPYIKFASEYVDVTAVEAMQAAADNKSPGERDRAKEFLLDTLSGGGPLPSEDVIEAAEANGISKRTLYRAKDELGIKATKDGELKDGSRGWRWHLPTKGKTHA